MLRIAEDSFKLMRCHEFGGTSFRLWPLFALLLIVTPSSLLPENHKKKKYQVQLQPKLEKENTICASSTRNKKEVIDKAKVRPPKTQSNYDCSHHPLHVDDTQVESHPSILHRKKGNQWTFFYGSTNRYHQVQLQWNIKESFSFHICPYPILHPGSDYNRKKKHIVPRSRLQFLLHPKP